MTRKFEEALQIQFVHISDIVSKFAEGKVKPGKHRSLLEMDISIYSIGFISLLKLRGFDHFEAASLLDYTIQLAGEEPGCENLLEFVRCKGLLSGLGERMPLKPAMAFA